MRMRNLDRSHNTASLFHVVGRFPFIEWLAEDLKQVVSQQAR